MCLTALVSTSAFAYDFMVDNIYYDITSEEDLTCSVTYSNYNGGSYKSDVVIPSTVTYNEKIYSVTSIGLRAFFDCSSITSIKIPNSVISIGENAFQGCTLLSSVELPNSLTSIGKFAFVGCTNLTDIEVPNSMTSIGERAFSNSSITNIKIPNSVISIGNNAFSGCSNLSNIVIPNSVTSIDKQAFYNCDGLQSVVIGTGVKTIGKEVFHTGNYYTSNSRFLTKVIWLPNTPPEGYKNVYSTVHYVANDQYGNRTIYPYLSSMFEVDGIKYVPVNPSERTCDIIDCAYDSTAQNIKIGNTVNYRGIDMHVNAIHPYAFQNNRFINTLVIDFDGDIPKCAFSNCDSITSADIKAKSAHEKSFFNCSALSSLKLETDSIGTNAFMNSARNTPAKFDVKARVLGQYAFTCCSKLTEITLSEDVELIDYQCFSSCSSLQSIVLPNAVKSLASHSFSGCSALTSVHIGTGIEEINLGTFNGCSSLPTITIPNNIKSIDGDVFNGCTALAEVIIADRQSELSLGYKNPYSGTPAPLFADCPLKTIYIGGNINYKTSKNEGYSPFYRNTTLEEVTITDEETEISENMFYGCSSLKNITMGDGVETIGNWAFSGCSSLESFAFGSGMKTIGKEAFSDCTAMTSLSSSSNTPPTCGENALNDINKFNCTLHIAEGTLSAYQAADQWKDFFFINDDLPNAIVGIDSENLKEVSRYNINGCKIDIPQKGINIIRYKDGSTKKVLVK